MAGLSRVANSCSGCPLQKRHRALPKDKYGVLRINLLEKGSEFIDHLGRVTAELVQNRDHGSLFIDDV